MKRMIRWLIGLVIIGALAFAGWMVYNKEIVSQSAQGAAGTTTRVQVVKLATSNVASTISATGSVRSNQKAKVTWQASGKVGTINVKAGDQVQANDILAVLDPGALPAAILTAKEDLPLAQAALSALTSSQSSLYQAEKDVIDAQAAVDKAQNHRDMMNSDTRGTTQQIADATVRYLMAQDKVNRMRQIYESLPGDPTTEYHNKAPALLNLEKAKTERNTALATLNWYVGKWTASDIAPADQALTLAKARLADAQAALARLQNGPSSSELAAAQLRIANDQAVIETQTITAPISGTITSVASQIGDGVSSGTVSFRIDDLSAYYVDLSVSEVDVASVRTGQPATITFDAISDKTYHGIVTKVAPVGTTSNGVVGFTVTVQIADPDSAIKIGMTTTANIVVASAENVLVVPSKAIKTVGDQKVVYLLSGISVGASATSGDAQGQAASTMTLTSGEEATATPISVEVGLSSGDIVQITSGQLKAGDLIAINPPASALARVAPVSTQN